MSNGPVCRYCKRPIEWAITAKNGRRIPLDMEPTALGNLIEDHRDSNGTAVVRKIEPGDPAARMPHMASCPNYKARKR